MKMILDERGKKYILKEGEDFQSDLGIVSAEVLSAAEIGDEVKSHLDHSFKIVKPNVNDFIDLMDRRCSILIKKDIGTVLAYAGLGAGSRVVDAGTGAGAIALNFGNVVGEDGQVYTYEIREDFADDLMIYTLNTRKMPYIDQDAWNKLGVDKALPLPVRHNEAFCTGTTERPAIVHFAGYKNWTTDAGMPRAGRLRTYRCATWPHTT